MIFAIFGMEYQIHMAWYTLIILQRKINEKKNILTGVNHNL